MDAEGFRALLSGVRYEVLPAKAAEDKVLAHVPRDVVVTVTASPVKAWSRRSTSSAGWRRTVTASSRTCPRGCCGTTRI